MAPHLNRLIHFHSTQIYFYVHGMADLYAAGGLVAALGIPRKRVLLKKIGREIDLKKVRKVLAGFSFTRCSRPPRNAVLVKFDTEGPARLNEDGSVIATYDPFKYFLPRRRIKKNKSRIRLAMKLAKTRKVIAVSCTTADEVQFVIRACKKLQRQPRPLLIFAMRRPDPLLAKRISKQEGLRVLDRRSHREPLSGFGKSDVVILNTMGELFDLMPVSDLAIVGHDRNIFEPAFLGVPVLYFAQPLNMHPQDKQLARWFKLFWRKNRTAKFFLDRFGGAAAVKKAFFHRQIESILLHPRSMSRGARRAVHAVYREILPVAACRTGLVMLEAVKRLGKTDCVGRTEYLRSWRTSCAGHRTLWL